MTQKISVIITDLDNTLYDWLDVWHAAFKAMLDRLVQTSGVTEETLLREFKNVHERYGTSEYSFSIEELPSLQKKFPGEDLAKKFEDSITAYREARSSKLKLYPYVLETLRSLKDKGCLLIGYTESAEYYTARRVKKLGLDLILDYLWSSPDSELPNGLKREQIRTLPSEYYELRKTDHRTLPKGELKPNPKVLADIIKAVGAVPEETIYVGDDLMKDVWMAQKAGVTDVWAKFGVAQNRPEYKLLSDVTHWSNEDVERQKKITVEVITPTHTLKDDFHELLSLFEFSPYADRSPEQLKSVLDMWQKTIDVQMHFNDLELRVRNYAVTVLAALLGLGGYALKEGLQTSIFGHPISVATVILLLSILPWLAFYIMDRLWYHRLLLGAVQHGTFIENRWASIIPEIGLTCAISKGSSVKIGKWRGLHVGTKINICYGLVLLLILLFALFASHAVHIPAAKPASPQTGLLDCHLDKPRTSQID